MTPCPGLNVFAAMDRKWLRIAHHGNKDNYTSRYVLFQRTDVVANILAKESVAIFI